MSDEDRPERLRSGRLGRVAMLGKMAAGLAGSAASAAGRWAVSSREEANAALHRAAAERLMRSLGEMRGLPMKLGQLLSYLDGVVPPEHQAIYAETLGKLRSKAQPMAWSAMSEVLRQELGRPTAEVFAHFDVEPIASASIGQVYRARLHDGRDVAVKIQYPGIDEAIHNDLKNVEALLGAMSTLLPRMEIEHSLRDMTSRIKEECDYRLEAMHQRRFRTLWADDPEVVIPAVVEELSSARVLVSMLVDGASWEQMMAAGPDQAERSRVGRALFRFVFRSLYRHGLFNADPHPGNYLFLDDGRVAFLDYGCVQSYDAPTLDAIRRIRDLYIAQASYAELRPALQEALKIPDVFDEEVWQLFEGYMRFCFEPVSAPQPFRFTREYTTQISRMTTDFKLTMMKKVFKTGMREPGLEGFVFLTRIIFGLSSLLAHLGAEDGWLALTRECEGEPTGRVQTGTAAL